MPAFSITSTGARDGVPIGNGCSVSITGTFVATLTFERAPKPGGVYVPIALDVFGTPATYTSTLPVLPVIPVPGENDALIRINCTSYTSGTATVQIGA